MDLKKRAEELHHTPEPHYNCAQATLIPFAEELGLDRQTSLFISLKFKSPIFLFSRLLSTVRI